MYNRECEFSNKGECEFFILARELFILESEMCRGCINSAFDGCEFFKFGV